MKTLMYCAGCGIPWIVGSPCRQCGGNAPCRCSAASAKAIQQSYAVLNSNPPSGGPEFDADETNDLLFSASPPADYRIPWHISDSRWLSGPPHYRTISQLWRYAGLDPEPELDLEPEEEV